MAFVRCSLAAITTLALSAAGIGVDGGMVAPMALAGEPLAAPFFSIPDQLPVNTLLLLDGSSSLADSNEEFRQRLLARYPDLAVQITASGGEGALAKLRRGEVDVVALGRRLTRAEWDQGLVEVPISREKIALIVGSDNPLGSGITLEQLAQIFYGDLDNWAALGGPDVPLRFVDRPESSDTRQALGGYPAFAERGLTPGPTVVPVGEDSTEAVIAALGRDGLGYAVVSQVQGRDDVRMLTVDEVLPTDPRYPYSQPRVYVYNTHNPSPAALAFVGVVNTPANLADFPSDDGAGVPAVSPLPAGDAVNRDAASLGGDPSSGDAWGRQGQSWAWLLAIPLLGGVVWWLIRQQDQRVVLPPSAETPGEAPGRIILTPCHCRRAYAYWEVSDERRSQQRERGGRTLMLRLLDVTDRNVDHHPPARIEALPLTEDQRDVHLPIPTANHDYQVELGYLTQEDHWLPLVKSAPVGVPAFESAPTGTRDRVIPDALMP
jgi:phosphate transport system substrate-binding protein